MTEHPQAPRDARSAVHADSERVIVLAPTPRDGAVTRQLVANAGIEAVVASHWSQAAVLVREGAGAMTVTDITLADPESAGLLQALAEQPAWSDLPVVALCRQGLQAPALRGVQLRSMMVLDRPTSMRSLLSAVMTALRGRRWQYQIRDHIESLREADQRKDEFLATLAHELRNPLAPLRTGLQLLDPPPPDEAQYRHVIDMMNRQMQQLLRLIDDLLEVSRISTGKLVLQRERMDLHRAVEMALEASRPLIEHRQHELVVSVPAGPVWVDGDLTRLAQTLSNLLNNAAKYTPDGGHVGLTLVAQAGRATLTVRDDGVGLPADMTNRVFEMFAQVHGSLERSHGGLGIGLALVKSLVMLHGGRVSAESAGPGQGSSFTIELPLAVEQPSPADSPESAAPVVPESRSLRVLIVDDNDDAAQSLAMLLSVYDHDARVANSGAEGLQLADTFLPQVVLCDIGMPGMNGHEFASRLRQDPRFASTLLVALTGWGAEDDKQRSREAGFDEHLTKPTSMDAVFSLLARL